MIMKGLGAGLTDQKPGACASFFPYGCRVTSGFDKPRVFLHSSNFHSIPVE